METEISNDLYYDQLVIEHYDKILFFIMSEMNDHALAQDLTQEVFVVAWHAVKLLRSEVEKPRRWLTGVAINLISNARRGDNRRTELYKKLSEQYVIDEILRNSLQDRESERFEDSGLHAALLQLKEKERKLIFLHYFEEVPAKQIAALIGLTPKAAEKRIERARKKLAEAYYLWQKTK